MLIYEEPAYYKWIRFKYFLVDFSKRRDHIKDALKTLENVDWSPSNFKYEEPISHAWRHPAFVADWETKLAVASIDPSYKMPDPRKHLKSQVYPPFPPYLPLHPHLPPSLREERDRGIKMFDKRTKDEDVPPWDYIKSPRGRPPKARDPELYNKNAFIDIPEYATCPGVPYYAKKKNPFTEVPMDNQCSNRKMDHPIKRLPSDMPHSSKGKYSSKIPHCSKENPFLDLPAYSNEDSPLFSKSITKKKMNPRDNPFDESFNKKAPAKEPAVIDLTDDIMQKSPYNSHSFKADPRFQNEFSQPFRTHQFSKSKLARLPPNPRGRPPIYSRERPFSRPVKRPMPLQEPINIEDIDRQIMIEKQKMAERQMMEDRMKAQMSECVLPRHYDIPKRSKRGRPSEAGRRGRRPPDWGLHPQTIPSDFQQSTQPVQLLNQSIQNIHSRGTTQNVDPANLELARVFEFLQKTYKH